MREETYDIPGYQFGLMIPRGIILNIYKNDERYVTEFDRYVQRGETTIVPFENVDGLTVVEVINNLKKVGFAFVCYAKCQYVMETPISNNFHLYYKCIFAPEFLKHNMSLRVDQLIENHLTSIYPAADDTVKKMCRCFFERYQDKDYQKTSARVKKL